MNTGTGQTDTQPEWMRRQERSNLAILRLMVWISLAFGRRVGRLVLHGIAVYFVLFAPAARRASRAYLHRVLGRYAGWRDGYRHVFSFASTIHDRIYLLNDRFNVFDIEVRGDQALLAAIEKQPGALLMGAHLGSFEVLRAMGRGKKGLRVAMLMYEQNARKLSTPPWRPSTPGRCRISSPWGIWSRCWRCATSSTKATWWACWRTAR
jgi:predicted LPLAT superfamily acyltransferase